MKFILGKKIGMTQIFRPSGEMVPVTRVLAGPCQIVQIKDGVKDNHKAVQIGFGERQSFRVKKPEQGHLKDLTLSEILAEFAVENADGLARGDLILADTFLVGDMASVVGVSKGKGFAGVVKRHHFRGAPKSHGHKHDLRAPGSIGAGGVQRVFKGMRMAGRMGGDRVTVKNLEIVEIHPETNELYIKGAVPGGRNAMLQITASGNLKITKQNQIKPAEIIVPEVADSVAAAPALAAAPVEATV